jgi:hypothetical protein
MTWRCVAFQLASSAFICSTHHVWGYPDAADRSPDSSAKADQRPYKLFDERAQAQPPMILLLKGMIGSTPTVLAQVVNPFVFLLILWLGERWRDGALVTPVAQNVHASAAAQ